jgi:hypothetical protein
LGQQHVTGCARAAQAVAQHVGQHLRRGAFGRRIEGGDAQGFPQKSALARRRLIGVQPFRHGDVGLDAETAGLQVAHEADRRPFFAPVEATGEEQGAGGMQWCRQGRRAHQELAGELEAQRRASQQSVGIGADGAYQAQGFDIGADQDVLAVIDVEAVD